MLLYYISLSWNRIKNFISTGSVGGLHVLGRGKELGKGGNLFLHGMFSLNEDPPVHPEPESRPVADWTLPHVDHSFIPGVKLSLAIGTSPVFLVPHNSLQHMDPVRLVQIASARLLTAKKKNYKCCCDKMKSQKLTYT